jgi:exopolysaccharide biosynthesis polyprenyl glycosylphosphotransferase
MRDGETGTHPSPNGDGITVGAPLIRMPRRSAAEGNGKPRGTTTRQRPTDLTPEPVRPVWDALPHDGDVPEGVSDRVVLRRDAVFRRALAAVDMLAVVVALFVSIELVGGGRIQIEPVAVLLLPLLVLCCKAAGLYDRDQHLLRKTTIDEAPSVLHMSVLFAVIVWLGEGFFVEGFLNRAEVLALGGVAFVCMLFGRAFARSVALRMAPPERCVVLGNAGAAANIASKLQGATAVNATILGRVALDDGSYNDVHNGPPLLGQVDLLGLLLAEHEVERVIIAPDGHDQELILQSMRLVKALGVRVSVLPRLLEVVGSTSSFDEIEGITLLGVRQYGLSRSSELLKRGMDVAAASIGLLILAPVFAILAAAIKIDSRGPLFFRQRRIGRSGKEIYIFKFRSMVQDAERMKDALRDKNEAEGLFKIEDDPRITRVGHFVRRASLDELPQLINVLKGDMSLVGPRPLVPDEDAMIEGWQRRRLAVKPGMTGLWQIFGSSRIPMREMVKIDYFYGANWSLWLDLKILLRTVPYILSRRGQ